MQTQNTGLRAEVTFSNVSPGELALLAGALAAETAAAVIAPPAQRIVTSNPSAYTAYPYELLAESGDVVLNGGAMTRDHRTTLVWTHDTLPGGEMDDDAAREACATLRIGGFSDWRLPTIRELLSIVDYERENPAIDTTAFQCEPGWYRTCSPFVPFPGYSWIVNFNDGNSGGGRHGASGFVRAVRAGQ